MFGCKWESQNVIFKEVTDEEIGNIIQRKHINVHDLVTLFIDKIIAANKNDEERLIYGSLLSLMRFTNIVA